MATKKNFQVELPTDDATTPFIYRTEQEDTGVTWGQAKKQMRKWYLDEARKLRSLNVKEFTKREQQLLEGAKVESVSSPV